MKEYLAEKERMRRENEEEDAELLDLKKFRSGINSNDTAKAGTRERYRQNYERIFGHG